MKAQSPFVHKFQSLNRNYYIYDVWTNRVVRVNEIVYDLIDDFGVLRYPEIIRKWMKKCPLSSIKSALTEIEIAQKKGLFLDKRFKQMVVPYDDIYLGNAIASNIGYMIVNITEACNMRCKYCAFSGTYKYERPHSNRSMDEFILCKAVDYYLKHSQNSKIRGLSFYGGEPLLAFKKITAVQKILKAKDFEFRLDTNGLLLGKKEIVDFIVRHGIGMQVSLDGPAV
ncbi:MAG: radical SAM protein [candidate division WOR-3 bacterium]